MGGAIVLADVAILVFSVVYFSLVERASTRFRGSRPTYCSIYQIDFWRTERFFKLKARRGCTGCSPAPRSSP